MKLNVATATVVLAVLGSAAAESVDYSIYESTAISKREAQQVELTIARLADLQSKRSELTYDELAMRESQIVTDVLTAIKNTNLAPKIIKWLVTDPTLGPLASNLIVQLIKNKVINLGALLKALNDSGLAVQVVKDLINDCSFYADIYKLVWNNIKNLPQLIGDIISGIGKREDLPEGGLIVPKRDLAPRDASDDLVTSLMESLKDSGLATQVVRQLITDQGFLEWGADLIKQLFEEKALSLSDVLDAVVQSGLVPSLIDGLLNFDTIKTVIVNALAAAFGKCNGSSLTTASAPPSTSVSNPFPSGTGTSTTAAPVPTSGGGNPTPTKNPNPNCKKRRRSYNYNY